MKTSKMMRKLESVVPYNIKTTGDFLNELTKEDPIGAIIHFKDTDTCMEVGLNFTDGAVSIDRDTYDNDGSNAVLKMYKDYCNIKDKLEIKNFESPVINLRFLSRNNKAADIQLHTIQKNINTKQLFKNLLLTRGPLNNDIHDISLLTKQNNVLYYTVEPYLGDGYGNNQ